MSEKLGDEMREMPKDCTPPYAIDFADRVAALEQQLAAKDAEIARLRTIKVAAQNLTLHNEDMVEAQLVGGCEECWSLLTKLRAALAGTPAAPIPVCEMCGWVKAECVCTTKRCPCGVLGCSGTHLRESSETPAAPEAK